VLLVQSDPFFMPEVSYDDTSSGTVGRVWWSVLYHG
jgi:hypothetical protein